MKLTNEYLLSLGPIALFCTIMYSTEEDVDAINYASMTDAERAVLLTRTIIGQNEYNSIKHLLDGITIFNLLELSPVTLYMVVNSINPKDIDKLEYDKLNADQLSHLMLASITGHHEYEVSHGR